ncbi:MAG TPA: tetratricopeptide repeat-containing glycosyltransferase family protein [Burkholderiales bacterium]|nr:tetratricopeptide repeat-containing glycosyltransferase family protein [Burkholderiales bacterium]
MFGWFKSRLSPPPRGELLRKADAAYREGATARVREHCLAVLQQAPDDARALFLLASAAADDRLIDEGLRWARRAVAVRPADAAPHYALARVWEAAQRYGEAEASYRAALARDGGDAKTHNNLGAVLQMQGRFDEALACYRRALEIDPAQPQANQNYAAIVHNPASQQVAIQHYRSQAAANPRDAAAHQGLAAVYTDLGRLEEALASFERAIELEPQRADLRFSRALVLLACGRYAEGWEEYEWRWRVEAFNAPARRFPQPLWNGAPLSGTLLLHGETGLGDTLQFVRYARLAAQRCDRVVLECQPALKDFLRGLEGAAQVVAQGEPLPEFAAHLPLIGLPRRFATTLESIPWTGPYVHADPALVETWRARLRAQGAARLSVGLCWTGSPQNMNNRRRSLGLEDFAPLGAVPGARFYSLQKSAGAEQPLPAPPGMSFVDLVEAKRDFPNVAALIGALDVVVTVDTSIAHLAGAMGAETWVVLNHSPDWRYHRERSDNPWYPTQRLFRQAREGDWTSVVREVKTRLESRLA